VDIQGTDAEVPGDTHPGRRRGHRGGRRHRPGSSEAQRPTVDAKSVSANHQKPAPPASETPNPDGAPPLTRTAHSRHRRRRPRRGQAGSTAES
jgi:hypothetical protein